MEVRFDWPKIYGSILSTRGSYKKRAYATARRIRQHVEELGLESGCIIGSGPDLCRRYDVGRETLLETVRLLEEWQVARMRRGPGGGLFVLPRHEWRPAPALARYFRACCLTKAQAQEAAEVVSVLALSYSETVQGRAGEFDDRFRRSLEGSNGSIFSWHIPEVAAGRVLQPFIDALGIHSLGGDLAEPIAEAAGQGRGESIGGSPLANVVAQQLSTEMATCLNGGRRQLGCQPELMERMGVSRQVLRQALRLLEGRGVLECRRGRGNGVSASAGHPAVLLEQLVDHYDKQDVTEGEFRPVQATLDRVNRLLVASRWDSSDYRSMRRIAQDEIGSEAEAHLGRWHFEWRLLNNPVLSLLEQLLAAYRSKRAGDGTYVGIGDIEEIRRGTLQQFDALQAANLPLADRIHLKVRRESQYIMTQQSVRSTRSRVG